MIVCASCSTENSDSAALCVKCGEWFRSQEVSAESERLASAQPPAPELLKPPRPYFINRPWLKDWVFWLPVVFITVGQARASYREGANGLGAATGFTYSTGVTTILALVPLGFVVFGVLPALIRWPFRKRRFNKLLAIRPDDESEGWKRDPFDPAAQRWWAGSFWSQGTRPQSDEKVGVASGLIIAGVFAVLFLAFLFGTGNRGFGGDPDLANVDVQELLNTVDPGVLAGMSADQVFATAVADAYFRTRDGLNDYYAFETTETTETSDLISQYIELEAILIDSEASQSDLQRLVTPATTQEQIGGARAPDVNALRDFTVAMGEFVSTYLGYFDALEACEPLSAPGREYGFCDDDAFTIWEAPMTQTLAPLAASYQAVIDSMKPE